MSIAMTPYRTPAVLSPRKPSSWRLMIAGTADYLWRLARKDRMPITQLRWYRRLLGGHWESAQREVNEGLFVVVWFPHDRCGVSDLTERWAGEDCEDYT